MEGITFTGAGPHITSMQHRAIFEMIIGAGSYILNKNELLEPELQSNNILMIRSGMLAHHGGIIEVKASTYDEVEINNGTQGMQRIDLIVARYTKNPETEVETVEWIAIQGEPAETNPVVPDYVVGNMQNGDLIDDCPVFEVHLNGIQVTEIKKLLTVLDGDLAGLNSNLSEKAPKNHASTGTGFGVATTSNYGHVKLINALTADSYSAGQALSAYQGYLLSQKMAVSTGSGTRNTNNCVNGDCYYRKFGRIVVVDLYDIKVNKVGNSAGVVLFSGLPKCLSFTTAILSAKGNSNDAIAPMRVGIDSSATSIVIWWDGTLKTGNLYSGQLIYISAS